jgi:histidinol phosphatase-like enzyme
MVSGPRRAVFLDPDGVLNRAEVREGNPYSPRQLEAFRLLPGVRAAVKWLKEAGLFVMVSPISLMSGTDVVSAG